MYMMRSIYTCKKKKKKKLITLKTVYRVYKYADNQQNHFYINWNNDINLHIHDVT